MRENQMDIKIWNQESIKETCILTIPLSLPTAKQEVLEQKEIAVTDASTPVMS